MGIVRFNPVRFFHHSKKARNRAALVSSDTSGDHRGEAEILWPLQGIDPTI